MNIPSKVKIGYKDYTVNKIDDTVVTDDIICYGNIDFNKSIINISTLHHEEQQKCTFIHECLHGIDEIVEAKLTEDQVRLISKGLYDFIKTNPDVFESNSKQAIIHRKSWINGKVEETEIK